MTDPKPIEGFPDYMILSDGRIFRVTRHRKAKLVSRKVLAQSQWRQLRPYRDGYERRRRGRWDAKYVTLIARDGKKSKRSVNKLVREHFPEKRRAKEWFELMGPLHRAFNAAAATKVGRGNPR